MYAELKIQIKGKSLQERALLVIKANVGGNAKDKNSLPEGDLDIYKQDAFLAEYIGGKTIVLYAWWGSDVLVAFILAKTLSQLKEECARISRQVEKGFENSENNNFLSKMQKIANGEKQIEALRVVKVEARIIGVNDNMEEVIVSGQKIPLKNRFKDGIKEKFIPKFLPPFIIAAGAANFLANTPSVMTAQIGVVAALCGAIWELGQASFIAGDWKWKEAS